MTEKSIESRAFFMQLYIKNSGLPKMYYANTTLKAATDNDLEMFRKLKEIEDDVANFVKEGKNLLISSNMVGNGKTTWATKILKSYVTNYACYYSFPKQNQTPALYVNFPEFLNQKKLAISNPDMLDKVKHIEDSIYTAKLVVFDDIATKLASDYDKELLYVYINYRTSNKLSTIYTTNISSNMLESQIGARVADRITGYSECIEFNGPGRRGC